MASNREGMWELTMGGAASGSPDSAGAAWVGPDLSSVASVTCAAKIARKTVKTKKYYMISAP